MRGLLFPQLCLALCNTVNQEEIKPCTPQPFKLSTEYQASLFNLYLVSPKSATVTGLIEGADGTFTEQFFRKELYAGDKLIFLKT